MVCASSVSNQVATADALLSVQKTGLAGIVLKYSMATLYPPACCDVDQEVVPRQFFTHLPAGFLPGLAVQVCAQQRVTANVVCFLARTRTRSRHR